MCCGGCVYVGEGERAKRMSGKGELMNGGDGSVALLSSAGTFSLWPWGRSQISRSVANSNKVVVKPSFQHLNFSALFARV